MLKSDRQIFAILMIFVSSFSMAQQPDIEKDLLSAGAEIEVFKTTSNSSGEEVKLNIYIFKPENHKPTDKRSAIVFFFGGGWNTGKPTQFTEHCKHLAKKGMVSMTADYRVKSRHGTKAISCVEDGKSAIRWVRQNASKLGIDSTKVVAAGGSAGGHVAACTGVIKTLDHEKENLKISSVPNAMVLFNPVLATAKVEGSDQKMNAKKIAASTKRIGASPVTVSPVHHVVSGIPPTLILHGNADKVVPFWIAEVFQSAMDKAGNRCELVEYKKQGHGFFNHGRKGGKYEETVEQMDKFLMSLGFLQTD